VPAPDRYTLVPWEEVQAKDKKKADPALSASMPEMPSGGYNLMNRSVTKLDDTETLFDDSGMTHLPRRPADPPLAESPVGRPAMPGPWRQPEEIEMTPRE